MSLDRLPVALGSLLCGALTFFWIHAPALPDGGSSAGFAAEFVRATTGGAAWLYYASHWLAPAFAALVFMEAGGTVARNALGTELFPTRLRSTAKPWITNAAVVGAVAGWLRSAR